MTFTECAGNQDRDTEASEVRPTQAPIKTENCYSITDPFEYSQCGTSADTACNIYHYTGTPGQPSATIIGSSRECTPDDFGGYCDYKGGGGIPIKFTSNGGNTLLTELKNETLISRYETSREDRGSREESDLSRTIKNVVREGRNNSAQASILNRETTDSPVDTAGSSLSTTMTVFISILSVLSMGLLFFFIWRNRKSIFGSGKRKPKVKVVSRSAV